MSYTTSWDTIQLKGLNVGDKVKFGFRMEGSVAKIVSIHKQ